LDENDSGSVGSPAMNGRWIPQAIVVPPLARHCSRKNVYSTAAMTLLIITTDAGIVKLAPAIGSLGPHYGRSTHFDHNGKKTR